MIELNSEETRIVSGAFIVDLSIFTLCAFSGSQGYDFSTTITYAAGFSAIYNYISFRDGILAILCGTSGAAEGYLGYTFGSWATPKISES